MALEASDSTTAKARYELLRTGRDSYLAKARRCSELSIPFIVPPEGKDGQDLPTPYQSVGARGVNNLAAKLLLALLPPNTPFFKLAVDQFALKQVAKDPKVKTKLEEALSEIEQAVLTEIETSAVRPTVFESLVHLIVAGNGLVEIPPEGTLKFYRLDRYVVQRDPMGSPKLIIIHESVAPSSLPEKFLKAVFGANPKTGKGDESQQKAEDKDKHLDLYTVCERVSAEKWEVWQEAKGREIPNTFTSYPADKFPFIPLRLFKIDGEDYGRGLVEQYLGDLISLDGLSQAVLDGSLAASRVLFLCAPAGVTNPHELAKADNGAFVTGKEEDVHPLQLGKFADFATARAEKQDIEARLNAAFMVMAGMQRDAERVTAEEIRALIQELETALGGVYSVLAQEYQLPLASALMARMSKDKRLPKLPKKIVAPTITTGVEALGRGNDLQKLDLFVKDIAQTFGPEALVRFVDTQEYLTRRATALGINVKGLVRTAEELQQADEAASQQAMAQTAVEKLGPVALKAVAEAQRQSPA